MKEVFPGRPETETAKTNVIDFETARQKRHVGEKPQRPRPVTQPPSQELREERYTDKRQDAIREELGKTGEQAKGVHESEQDSMPPGDRRLFDEILGGQTEEEINAHNEQFKARREKERAEKEKLHDEARAHYTRYHERLAAMTPEERAAYDRELERTMTGLTPLSTEEFKNLMRTMSANVRREERKKAAWVHERDPRYDPMTGDLLESDEFPLDAKAEYYFDGRERPRRFIPPDSPHLNDYKPLETEDGPQVSEGEYRDRLVNRLLKAGFTEVEPTLADKALYEKTQWFNSLPSDMKMQLLQEALEQMTRNQEMEKFAAKEKATGEKVAKFIEALFAFLISLISPEVADEMRKKESDQKAA